MIKRSIRLLFLCLTTLGLNDGQCQTQCVDKMSAQTKKDVTQINQIIETYFEGWMTGDTTKLSQAMHRTCQLKNIKDNDVIIYERATYLGFFKPRERRKNAGGRIISIDVTDHIGSAKCEIFTADRLYTDYFNLMKIKDRWFIVDKIASSKEI